MTERKSNRFAAQSPDPGEVKIIQALNDAEGFVSGNALAKIIGLSRTSVHTKIESLKSVGFKIEAVTNKGYELRKMPQIINPHLLTLMEYSLPKNFKLRYYPQIDSTNEEAERQLAAGLEPPFAIIANKQTKGKGRLGRTWQSQSDKNLYCSILFAPNSAPQKLQKFTLWAGIEICQTLKDYTENLPIKIKWPNDLYCNGKKLSGMLTEARIDADRIHTIAFGIGININSRVHSMPDAIKPLATSLKEETQTDHPLNEIAIRIIEATISAYERCLHEDPTDSLQDAWQTHDYLEGKSVALTENGRKLNGTAMGIDGHGALQLKTKDGMIHSIHSGDVTLRR